MPTCREVPACRAPPRERALAPALPTARAAAHADPAHTTAADTAADVTTVKVAATVVISFLHAGLLS